MGIEQNPGPKEGNSKGREWVLNRILTRSKEGNGY